MYSFNIILTELCNANCTHCYMNQTNNYHKKTLLWDNLKIVIDKLPKNTKKTVLTGGEIFLVSDLLTKTIKYIKEKNNNIEIELESNGKYLYTNITKAQHELERLKKIGVSSIRFSDDPFHESGGIDLDKVRSLKKLETNKTPKIKYLVQNKALGIGKAEYLKNEEKETMNCMNKKDTLKNPYIFLDIDLNAYICTWKCIPPLGNLLHDEWCTIEEQLNSDFNKLILKGKIEQAIKLIKPNQKNVANEGQCLLCYKTFKK